MSHGQINLCGCYMSRFDSWMFEEKGFSSRSILAMGLVQTYC